MLMMTERPREPGDAIDEVLHEAENCVVSLRSMAISNRILDISRELAAAEQSGDRVTLERLVAEQIQLARVKHEFMSRISAG
jgi:hypothetical protein